MSSVPVLEFNKLILDDLIKWNNIDRLIFFVFENNVYIFKMYDKILTDEIIKKTLSIQYLYKSYSSFFQDFNKLNYFFSSIEIDTKTEIINLNHTNNLLDNIDFYFKNKNKNKNILFLQFSENEKEFLKQNNISLAFVTPYLSIYDYLFTFEYFYYEKNIIIYIYNKIYFEVFSDELKNFYNIFINKKNNIIEELKENVKNYNNLNFCFNIIFNSLNVIMGIL